MKASKPHQELLNLADALDHTHGYADIGAGNAIRGLVEQLEAAQDALWRIAVLQDNALRYIKDNGFIFDDIGQEPGNWKHLAFSLYSDLCEADTHAHAGLDLPLGVRPGSNPAKEPDA